MNATLRLALFGLVSGAVTGAAVDLLAGDSTTFALYIAPGLAFGLIAGYALRGARFAQPLGSIAFIAAAILANSAAVYVGFAGYDALHARISDDTLAFAIVGADSGAIGAALLALAGLALLPRARFWPPAIAGTLCGALLPILFEGEDVGTIAFYMIWQGACAVSLTKPSARAT